MNSFSAIQTISIIRKLEAKLSRQKQAVSETEAHIDAMTKLIEAENAKQAQLFTNAKK